MIRVVPASSSLSSNLNSFHKTVVVTDNKFAVNITSSAPPPPGVFGVDKADPQPTFYPVNTTFFLSTSASRPLTVGLSVGSTYFVLTPGKLAGVDSLEILASGGYSGSVQKVYDGTSLGNFPLDISLFVDPPRGVYYLRLFDASDSVQLWQSNGLSNTTNVWLAAVPASLGLTTEELLYGYRGVVRRVVVDVQNTSITVDTVDRVTYTAYIPWGSSSRFSTGKLIFDVIQTI